MNERTPAASSGARRPWLAANDPEGGIVNVALLFAVGLIPGSAHYSSALVPALYFALAALLLLSRSLFWAWAATFAAFVAARLLPVDGWHDQTFVQLSSLAALLSGHGIYDPDNGLGMSWSIYLPMANLLAAFPVWFLGAKFWNFFQILVPLIYSLPLFVAPSQTTFRLFLVLAGFAPFAGMTGRGNALEIAVATLFAGFWLLLRGHQLPLAAALLAYGALLRQPLLFLVPFVALALWRLRARRALAAFGAVLVFGGLVHVLRNPRGFFAATFGAWPDFADQWFNRVGTIGNYTISTILAALGDEGAFERGRQPAYLFLLALSLAVLAVVAWRARSIGSSVVCAILATVLVHVLNRGFVHFHYVAAALFPAFAFVGREAERSRPGVEERRPASAGERLLVGAVGAAVAVLVATPLLLAIVGEVRSWRAARGTPVELASLHDGSRPVTWILRQHEPPIDAVQLDVRRRFRIELEAPTVPRELVLLGARIRPRVVDGLTMIYPIPLEVAGFLRSGRVEGSIDGFRWRPLARFRTWAHPSFYPTRIALDSGGAPVRYLRLLDGATWWGQESWLLGGVEVRGDPPVPSAAP